MSPYLRAAEEVTVAVGDGEADADNQVDHDDFVGDNNQSHGIHKYRMASFV